MNHNTELAMVLYARWNVAGSMVSICTCTAPATTPARCRWPSGAAAAACRSASDIAAQTHTVAPERATGRSPETRPPPPRRSTSEPSAAVAKLTGPRLDATSTVAVPAVGTFAVMVTQATTAADGSLVLRRGGGGLVSGLRP